MKLNLIKLIIVLALVSKSYQGIFSSIVNAVTNFVKPVVNVVQQIKENAYAFLSSDNIYVSGKCNFQGRTWDCTVSAPNGRALEVSGNNGNVNPEYRLGGDIRIPYAYVTGVTTSQRQYTVAFIRFTERSYYITVNRLGVIDTLTVDQNHPDSVNRFIDNINGNRSVRANILSAAKNSIIRLASVYNTQAQFIVSNQSSYTSTVTAITNLNNQISTATNELTRRVADKNSLSSANDILNKSVSNLLQIREQKQRAMNQCDSEIVATSNLLNTYVKYQEEFTESKAFEFLDQEYSNLCQFHLAAQDITLIIPTQIVSINKMRKDVTSNRTIDSVRQLFDSDEFFILKDK